MWHNLGIFLLGFIGSFGGNLALTVYRQHHRKRAQAVGQFASE